MTNPDIIIIGAGAAGLMAARELAKAGKKVLILEARNRVGGRIFPLGKDGFGYPADGGAEFMHGDAHITKELMKEAGLTYIPEGGDVWSTRGGALVVQDDFIENSSWLKDKLKGLDTDMPIFDFLELYFPGDVNDSFRNSVNKMVEAYDAADPKLMSSIALREEWFPESESGDGKIKEGYTALVEFLQRECESNGVEIVFNAFVRAIGLNLRTISVLSSRGEYKSEKVIVTVPPTVLKDIEFNSELKWKQELAAQIHFGDLIKIVFNFKTRWWENATENDLKNMSVLLCDEKFTTWWTQYSTTTLKHTNLVGWVAGPGATACKGYGEDKLLDIALRSLANALKVDVELIKKEIVHYQVINWSTDPYSKGGYSFKTLGTDDIRRKLAEPVDDAIYFAGEVYSENSAATVEGALDTGLRVAKRILGAKRV